MQLNLIGTQTQCNLRYLSKQLRRGTCPLTGGFAAKWHRRINGYDSGPSEPGDSPPHGTTKLWLWPAPIPIPTRAATIHLILSIYGYNGEGQKPTEQQPNSPRYSIPKGTRQPRYNSQKSGKNTRFQQGEGEPKSTENRPPKGRTKPKTATPKCSHPGDEAGKPNGHQDRKPSSHTGNRNIKRKTKRLNNKAAKIFPEPFQDGIEKSIKLIVKVNQTSHTTAISFCTHSPLQFKVGSETQLLELKLFSHSRLGLNSQLLEIRECRLTSSGLSPLLVQKFRHFDRTDDRSSPTVRVTFPLPQASSASSFAVRPRSISDFPFQPDGSYDILIRATTELTGCKGYNLPCVRLLRLLPSPPTSLPPRLSLPVRREATIFFDREERRELAACEGNFPFTRFFGLIP
ncbi:hypothetical protein M5K25_008526 [Dendrobium thyrsiflorum]|uniref:Uncharacterized protein n=1 Tax=Dendrobium thyrsiflorum TaxID=117978 RepID=A0ABD0V8N2_DENTH